ncbi:MAG: putative lipid flippase FtsW [Actinomycetota bacterium]
MSSSSRTATSKPKSSAFIARLNLGTLLRAESRVFYTILSTTILLVVIGLVMVLSASSIWSHLDNDGFFGRFSKQLLFAGLGLPVMLIISRFRVFFWKKWAARFLVIVMAAQLLVFTPLGVSSGGNTNWIRVGSFNLQPSELLKLALALWLGLVLPKYMAKKGDHWHVLQPLVLAFGSIGLVLLGQDLGTSVVLFAVVIGCLIYAGISWRHIFIPIGGAAFGFLLLAIFSPNRIARITTFFSNNCAIDANAASLSWCWQPLHGTWAMASGGIFGVGLGNSKAKWTWLPAADNDYIFAIIGEELGLIGCIVVIGLLIVLTISFLRVIHDAIDPFIRIATGGIMMWIIGQAFMNIAVVLGLLPVLGVPLPFISSGGTALFAALVGVGVVLSFAHENELTAKSR